MAWSSRVGEQLRQRTRHVGDGVGDRLPVAERRAGMGELGRRANEIAEREQELDARTQSIEQQMRRGCLELTGIILHMVQPRRGGHVTERQLAKNATRRLAIIRHAKEVSRNVALICRLLRDRRQVFYGWFRRYEAKGN